MAKTSVENFDPGRFRALRQKAGLTITELARRGAVSRGTISQWELGISTPSVETLTVAMEILDAHASEVMNVSPVDLDLKTLRVFAGCTRADVGQCLNLSASAWGDIERGTTPLIPERVLPLAELFGVDRQTVVDAAQKTLDH